MEIKGVTATLLRQRMYALRTDPLVSLLVTALPLGWHAKYRLDVPEPQPKFQRKDGQRADGSPIMVPDYDHERDDFRQRDADDDKALRASVIHAGLRHDQSVAWKSKREDFKSRLAFGLALDAELEEAGFTDAELNKLVKAVSDVSGLDDEALNNAKGFSKVC